MRRPLVLVACLSAAACANTDALEQELSRIRRDLHGMQKDLHDTRRQVERLEGRVTLLSLGKGAIERAPRTRVAGARAKPSRPEAARPARSTPGKALPVVRLGSKVEEPTIEEESGYEDGAMDTGQPPVLIKLGPSDDVPDKLPVDRQVLKKKDPVLHADPAQPPRELYKAALDKLREDKAPQAAFEMFGRFLEDHPSSRLADNALYWSGECLYVLARYEEAIARMDLLVERHPRSSKVPHALLRAGESLLALGLRDKGLDKLRRVVDRHPTSEAARRARARLDIEGGQR